MQMSHDALSATITVCCITLQWESAINLLKLHSKTSSKTSDFNMMAAYTVFSCAYSKTWVQLSTVIENLTNLGFKIPVFCYTAGILLYAANCMWSEVVTLYTHAQVHAPFRNGYIEQLIYEARMKCDSINKSVSLQVD